MPEFILICILGGLLLMHLGIIFRLIPYQMVWGGRLKSDKEMYQFEAISILLNSIFLLVALAAANYIQLPIDLYVIRVMLWAMAALFLLNTFGNMVSKNKFEQLFFTPLTIILSGLCSYIAYYL